MKILFLCRRFYPDIGGVEKHVLEISKRLIDQGHEITVVSEGKRNETFVYAGINVYKIPAGKNEKKKKFIIWKWLFKNISLIKEADVVHCHDVFYWYFPFRFLFLAKPVYTTFHGYESFPIRKTAIVIRKVSELLSWGNICIGEFMKKWYGVNPNYVSYGAVNIPKIKDLPVGKAGLRLKIKDFSAVFMGRLDEQTGVLTYVNAFELLKKKYPKFVFTVIGDGKYKKQISKKAKVLGFKKDPEKYFQNYNFAFVSRYLSILEAFAAKKLVFAVYDNPVKEDYLRMTPFAKFILIANNSQELAQQVENILYNPKRETELIAAAYQWVKKQSWEELIKVYFLLWRKKK